MPRSSGETRFRILEAAYTEFRRKGFARVGLDDIALAAKVTKRTLYYHFKSKDDLLGDVLEAQTRLARDSFDTFGDRLIGGPEEIVDALFDDLVTWSAQARWSGSGYTRFAIELADLPGHPARVIARRHKAMLEEHFAQRLADAGIASARERAREIWLLIEGAMVMMVIHGDPAYVRAAACAAKRLLCTPAKEGRSEAQGAPINGVSICEEPDVSFGQKTGQQLE